MVLAAHHFLRGEVAGGVRTHEAVGPHSTGALSKVGPWGSLSMGPSFGAPLEGSKVGWGSLGVVPLGHRAPC